jgi:sarcosine oxidase delta subunit
MFKIEDYVLKRKEMKDQEEEMDSHNASPRRFLQSRRYKLDASKKARISLE